LTNPTTTIAPIQAVKPIGTTESESNTAFGMDFPGLIEAPLMNDNPLLEDPVASGGDTTLYGQGADEENEDEDGDEDEDEGDGESENGSDDDDQ
jgi:hypothetical protein